MGKGHETIINVRFLALFCALLTSFTSASARSCKCTDPKSSCWPRDEAWQHLNSSISGRLLQPVPAAAPCYKDTFDNASCSVAMTMWSDPRWRADQPGAVQYTNWESLATQGCPLNTTTIFGGRCNKGNLPEFIVNASNPSDVQKAVRFASKYNLRLVVRTSGHSYNGGSTAQGSLSIWTRFMRTNITFQDTFRPSGCGGGGGGASYSAVTTDAGTVWEEVYVAATARNLVVVGGMPGSVGTSGGYFQGGGHGPLSHVFGLSADNVLEFQVVKADGELVVANECQNKDLFWALRGGGGGTFGVVVSSTHRTFPAFKHVIGVFYSILSNRTESLLSVTNKFIELQPAMSDAKWGGYFDLSSGRLFFGYLVPDGDESQVNQTLEGLLSLVDADPGLELQLGNVKRFDTFSAWRSAAACLFFPGCVESTGRNVAIASRLIPRETMEKSSVQLAQAMVNVLSNGVKRIIGCFTAGGKVTVEQDNAVNPVWRKALWQLVLPTGWVEGTTLNEQFGRTKGITFANSLLRDLTPDSGAYINEADFNEPNWRESLYGVNFDRLKTIKNKVDPNKLFVCHNCVGSEDHDAGC